MDPNVQKGHLSGSPLLNDAVNSDGTSWRQFKRQLEANYKVIAYYYLLALTMIMVGGWSAQILVELIAALWMQFLVIVLTGAWFAFWLTVITAHFHEAAHYNVCSNRTYNDLLTSVLLTPFIGLEIKSYRKSHWQHHKYLGTPRDTEVSYHRPVTFSNIISGLTGIFLVQTILRYWRIYKGSGLTPTLNADGRSFIRAVVIAGTTQSFIVVSLLLQGFWQISVAWMLGFIMFMPFLSMLRQTLEHRSLTAITNVDYRIETHGPTNRLFGTGIFSRLFGAAGFNRHLLHHWDPSVSYTCFDQMEAFFMETPLKIILDQSRSTYFQTFRKLLH